MGRFAPRVDPTVPKPFDFVPFAAVVRTPLKYGIETLWAGDGYFSGELEFSLKALAPLFVAAGRHELSEDVGMPAGEVVRAFYRVGGVPVIPASTLKGVVRGVAEAVSPSHVTTTSLRDLPEVLTRTDQCVVGGQSCPACALFGSSGRQAHQAHIGLVRFEDARLISNSKTRPFRVAALHAPRPKGALSVYKHDEGEYKGEYKGRKFYFHGQEQENPEGDLCEVLPKDALMRGRISFRNLQAPLLGLLFYALGFSNDFRLNLGSGKPVCLGAVEFDPKRLTLFDKRAALGEPPDPPLRGYDLVAFIETRLQEAVDAKLILGPQARELQRILKFPNNRQAPTGAY